MMNTVRRIWLVIPLLVLAACDCTRTEHNVAEFIESEEFRTVKSKREIPKFIIDSLTRYYSEQFTIGDSEDSAEICLSDFSFDSCLYTRKLQFALIGELDIVVVYEEGGIGVHDVVEWFHHTEAWDHSRYTTAQEIRDVRTLRDFIESDGAE